MKSIGKAKVCCKNTLFDRVSSDEEDVTLGSLSREDTRGVRLVAFIIDTQAKFLVLQLV